MNAAGRLRQILDANRAGEAVGIYSVCSAEPRVLAVAMSRASADGEISLIESTSNQVNQFGGYTGMTPADFRDRVRDLADAEGFPFERVLLGGDHLGPWPWRAEGSAAAMAKARDLVAACVEAGYAKIHLDASMRCADDAEGALDETVATERTVALCRVAEERFAAMSPGSEAPLYVIGTEVPIPGGEQAGDAAPSVTRAEDVGRVIERTRRAFEGAGLAAAWERVVAVVVQPGVEFGDSVVFDYEPTATAHLPAALEGHRLAFEAHSTDYQHPEALAALVRDHFAILKVGPGLTFAMREALFALERIEREMLRGHHDAEASRLEDMMDEVMLEHPEHWRGHHSGDEGALRLARAFSYSDRIRYYWPRPEAQDAVARLFRNLSPGIPPTLLSQFMPSAYEAVRRGRIGSSPEELVRFGIGEVIDAYARACGAD